MANVIQQNDSISDINYYLQARNELDSWFFLKQNWPIASILTIYASFIFIGLKFFEKRKPIDPKFFMFIFNIYQVITNAYMVYSVLFPDSLYYYLVNHPCHPVDPSKNPLWSRWLYVGKLFVISKLVDLLDTVFIVLRKKKSQVTFLHIYHHFGMVLISWLCLEHFGEQLVIVLILNPSVHVVMYSYYCLSLMGKSIQKYLWWKHYITMLQLFQFVIFMVHSVGLIAFGCQHSKPLSLFVFSQGFIFYALFTNFYIKQYRLKKVIQSPASPEKAKVM